MYNTNAPNHKRKVAQRCDEGRENKKGKGDLNSILEQNKFPIEDGANFGRGFACEVPVGVGVVCTRMSNKIKDNLVSHFVTACGCVI